MNNTNWEMVAAIGEVAGALFTFVGVITSLYVSYIALREVRRDRKFSQYPYVAFEPGGQRLPIEQKNSLRESKSDSDHRISFIGLKTDNGKITHMYHGLHNYGSGPAIDTEVTWVPEEITLAGEVFRIDERKATESKYSPEMNTIPASPRNLLPQQQANFFRIPNFIQLDTDRKIEKVTGHLIISYRDLLKQQHVTRQEFFIFTGYDSEPPYIHFTFSKIIEDASARRQSNSGVGQI